MLNQISNIEYKLILLLLLTSFAINAQELTRWVNPLIGTAPASTERVLGHGTEPLPHTIPSVTMPQGMTNWTPQTQTSEKKCLAPYYHTDTLISGFRGSHWLSGSCVQDYGSMTLMPVSGKLNWKEEDRASRFSHDKENATPSRYQVLLERYGIEVELTATRRCGLFRIQFPEGEPAFVIVEPNSDEAQGYVQVRPEKNQIVLYNPVHRIYQGWGEPAGFSGYFVIEFDRPFLRSGIFDESGLKEGTSDSKDEAGLGAYAQFELKENTPLLVRIGTSFSSLEQAEKNLRAEVPDWDFGSYQQSLDDRWNKLLGRVQVEGSDENKTIFYTALYHAFQHPRLFSDVDGTYPAFAGNGSLKQAEGFDYYDDFAAWDTYRAVHPLYNLLAPEISRDFIQSLITKAEAGGWMPIFPCWNSYTAAMIGDHLAAIIGDAFVKGVDIPQIEKAYRYLRRNAFEMPEDSLAYLNGKGRRALDSYMQYGYIPMEDGVPHAFHQKEQVSRTLEYAYDDFVLGQMAEALGRKKDAATLRERAQNYRHVFDPSVGYMRGRYADGKWYEAFEANGKMEYITEGTPKHYTWYVPQDPAGLITLMGGEEFFNAKLDTFFQQEEYWHGNEPCHQTYYLYNYSGQPWKTQEVVRKIMSEEYQAGPGGLSGNEDSGQMSAWYVFSAMGFYPVCPGTDEYVLGSPIFDEVNILLPGGHHFSVMANGQSKENKYIKNARLNGLSFDRTYLRHSEIRRGGQLELQMAEAPNTTRGVQQEQRPFSISRQ